MTLENQSQKQNVFDFIIVGAGISGLVVAHELTAQGYSVQIIEKSKSAGGRMATRRDEHARFDHGAQFMNLNSPELKKFDDLLSKQGLLQPWFQRGNNWVYACELGLNKVAKYFSQNLKISYFEKVLKIEAHPEQPQKVICESNKEYWTRNIILSCPLPQSLKILDDSQLSSPRELKQIEYAQAIVALIRLSPSSHQIMNIQYEEHINMDIFSICNQTSKKVSPVLAVTMTMSPDWSKLHFEDNEDELKLTLRQKFLDLMKIKSFQIEIENLQIKKWRYSHPLKKVHDDFFFIESQPHLYLIGDAFGGPSVAGSMRSALALSHHLSRTH